MMTDSQQPLEHTPDEPEQPASAVPESEPALPAAEQQELPDSTGEPEQSPTAAPEDDPTPPAAEQQELPASPIRPDNPNVAQGPSQRLVPTRPATSPLPPPNAQIPTIFQGIPTTGHSPENTRAYLRRRMTDVSQEFAAGRLNRAQFHAIYNRYNDQRNVIEKLLERDPDSEAWQQVALPGHTSFLRQHFTAWVAFLAIFPLGKLTPIYRHGNQLPRPQDILPVLKALPGLLAEKGSLPPASKPLKYGHWLVVVPGKMTVSMVTYSLEPSDQQIQKIADLHHDFEQANHHTLTRQDYKQAKLVFPQRALFESGDTGTSY